MLAPAHLPYRLRYAQSFFDVARPNWEAALEEWQQLVDFVESTEEKQMMQLYMARTRFLMGHHTAARKIIKKIDEPSSGGLQTIASRRNCRQTSEVEPATHSVVQSNDPRSI